MPVATRERAREMLCALGTSLVLTMRLFQALPESAARPQVAIVRSTAYGDGPDPRETLPNGAILTVPYRMTGFAGDGTDLADPQPLLN